MSEPFEQEQADAQSAPPAPASDRSSKLWWRGLQATATRRSLLLTALGGLLIAGISTALPAAADDPGRLVGLPKTGTPGTTRAIQVFDKAAVGDCLNWPNKAADEPSIVNCKDDHRFEVAGTVDMRSFPGSEYGPNAAAPTPARIQQISQEQCQASVKRYLGTKFDPNSKFTIGLLWSGQEAWAKPGGRQMLCGLQLPGAKNEQQAFKGHVAELDQSKVWQAGTCLGIETSTNQPTDIPAACPGPHATEVTGAVNLGEKFPGTTPAESDQDGYIKDQCTRMTDAYLAPVELRGTTLTLIYNTISLPSWTAGSRQVTCSIGATLGNGGWSTLVGSAKGPLLINGQPPVPPPDIPAERLNMPPIPLPLPTAIDASQPGQSQQGQRPQQTLSPTNGAPAQGNQHLPNAPGPQTVEAPAPGAPGQAPGPALPPPPPQEEPDGAPPVGAPPPPPPAEPPPVPAPPPAA